jgi:hypothetical protein
MSKKYVIVVSFFTHLNPKFKINVGNGINFHPDLTITEEVSYVRSAFLTAVIMSMSFFWTVMTYELQP